MDGYNWLLGDKRQTQPHYAKASCQSLDTHTGSPRSKAAPR